MVKRALVGVALTIVLGAVSWIGKKLITIVRDRGTDQNDNRQEGQQSEEGQVDLSDGRIPDREVNEHFESQEQRESWEAHKNATQRSPPVELGEVRKLGVEEITAHHTGKKQARGSIEGFQVFVDDVPYEVRPLDLIKVKIMSYGAGRTSAQAKFIEQT
jgi:predicted RNA-binding protein with TRAM domain